LHDHVQEVAPPESTVDGVHPTVQKEPEQPEGMELTVTAVLLDTLPPTPEQLIV